MSLLLDLPTPLPSTAFCFLKLMSYPFLLLPPNPPGQTLVSLSFLAVRPPSSSDSSP